MLSIRPVVIGQDENAGVASLSNLRDKENNILGSKTVLGQKQGAQQISTRKALGNITNTRNENSTIHNAGKPKEGRRALGDITNSGPTKPAPFSLRPTELKAKPVHKEVTQPVVANRIVAPKSKAELYADEGVERLAGKSWQELEAERVRREEEDIERRVKFLTSAIPHWQPASLAMVRSDTDTEDEMEFMDTMSSNNVLDKVRHLKIEDESAEDIERFLATSTCPLDLLPAMDCSIDHLLDDIL